MTTKRIDITSHSDIFEAIRQELNKDALYPLTLTTVVKLCGERAFSKLFPDRVGELHGLPRQRYEKIDF